MKEKKQNTEISIRSSAAEYLTFVAATGDNPDSIEMRYENENVWLTQKMLAELYDVSIPAINQHLKSIFEDIELNEDSVIKNYLITAKDGKQYNTKHYNLQAIIAVGFKINNQRAVQSSARRSVLINSQMLGDVSFPLATRSLKSRIGLGVGSAYV